jgi:hypothetical protein
MQSICILLMHVGVRAWVRIHRQFIDPTKVVGLRNTVGSSRVSPG